MRYSACLENARSSSYSTGAEHARHRAGFQIELSYGGDQHSKRNWISLKWGQVVVDRLIAFLGGLL